MDECIPGLDSLAFIGQHILDFAGFLRRHVHIGRFDRARSIQLGSRIILSPLLIDKISNGCYHQDDDDDDHR